MDPQAAWPPPPAPLPPPVPARPRRSPARVSAAVGVVAAAVAASAVGLAVSGASSARTDARPGSGANPAQIAAESLWRTEPADKILPPRIDREGTEAYFRLAIDPDESCAQLPAAFRTALGRAGCAHLVQATYLDSTQSVVATVGIVVTAGTAAERTALFQSWTADSYARQYAMMPATYLVAASPAANFHAGQRIAWKSSISNDGDYLAFAVTGFADGRRGPTPAAFKLGNESELQSDSPPVQTADDLSGFLLTAIAALEPSPNGSTS